MEVLTDEREHVWPQGHKLWVAELRGGGGSWLRQWWLVCLIGCLAEKQDDAMVQECNPNPCQNGGYCTSDVRWSRDKGVYCTPKCECDIGFGGEHCEIRTFASTLTPLRLKPLKHKISIHRLHTYYATVLLKLRNFNLNSSLDLLTFWSENGQTGER